MAKIKSMIGCELSINEIRAVEITKNNGEYQILAMGYMPLDKGIIEEGFIRDAAAFQEAFLELMKQGKFTSTDVAITANNENLIMRYAQFPKVDKDKLRSMVLLQAQEFIPIPINEMEIDYVIAGETRNEDGAEQYNIMLVAARKQMLEGYINHFSSIKYVVNEIDSSLLSLCRGIAATGENGTYFLVNFTDDVLNFIVVKGEEIAMVRSITVPDRSRAAIAEIFGLNETLEGEEEMSESEKEELVENAVALIMSETSSTISYYSMQNEEQIEKVYLVANSKHNNKVLKELQENLPIPVSVPKFYSSLQGESSTSLTEYASCIGVAISTLEG